MTRQEKIDKVYFKDTSEFFEVNRSTLQKEAKKSWDYKEALILITLLKDHLKAVNFGIAMAGSVLTEGKSQKDLDLIIFPHNASCFDIENAREELRKNDMRILWHRHEIAKFWHQANSTDNKHVEVWEWQGHRIDIFFLK